MESAPVSLDFQPTLLERLAAHFPTHKIHWRVGRTNEKFREEGEPLRGSVLAYLNARDVMERLDEVLGAENWMDEYRETPKRLLCTLSIRLNGEWISKTDGAGDTNIEGEKGGISDAFKRAAVKWGIGRYLYDCKNEWVTLTGNPKNPKLPPASELAALLPPPPTFRSKQQKTLYWKGLKAAAADDDAGKARELWDELTNEQRNELWEDLTNSSAVRSTLKDLLKATENQECAA